MAAENLAVFVRAVLVDQFFELTSRQGFHYFGKSGISIHVAGLVLFESSTRSLSPKPWPATLSATPPNLFRTAVREGGNPCCRGIWMPACAGMTRRCGPRAYLRSRRIVKLFRTAVRVRWNDRCRRLHSAVLGSMSKRVIHQHQRQHRLGNRCGANAHAGIVTPLGNHLNWLPLHIHASPRKAQAGGGLKR